MVATPRLITDRMSIPACQLHSATWTSQVKVLSLEYFIFEILIKLPGSRSEGLTSADEPLSRRGQEDGGLFGSRGLWGRLQRGPRHLHFCRSVWG